MKHLKRCVPTLLIVVTFLLILSTTAGAAWSRSSISDTNVMTFAEEAFGSNDPDTILEQGGIQHAIQKVVFRWAYQIYGGDFLKGISHYLLMDLSDPGMVGPVAEDGPIAVGSLWATARSVIGALAEPVGITLLAVFALTDLADNITNRGFDLEQFFKFVLKMSIGMLIISNLADIIEPMLRIFNSATNLLETAVTESDGAKATLYSYYLECSKYIPSDITAALSGIPMLLELVIPYLATFAARILVTVVAFSRIIELFVRIALAPIGAVDIYNGGVRSPGFRYLRKIFAVGIQGLLILLILWFWAALNESVGQGNSFLTPGKQVILSIAVIGMVTRSQQWANDVAGV